MATASDEALFHIRAAGSDHWVVYGEDAAEPVASFNDKASALSYALHRARTHTEPRPPLEASSSIIGRRLLRSTRGSTPQRR